MQVLGSRGAHRKLFALHSAAGLHPVLAPDGEQVGADGRLLALQPAKPRMTA